MKKLTIEYLRENKLIAYEYIRGSHAYGTNIEGSDIDIGGVYICPEDTLYGLRSEYVPQVEDEKHDTVFYEFGRWIELLLNSNPSAIESLFIPKECVIGKIHPAVKFVITHRNEFLTKKCFNPLLGFAFEQIKKAKGLNKKINIPEDFKRKDILDFCYTFKNQGSQSIKKFLSEYHLDQKYCGLVNIPNMKDVYGVYYDFAAYFKFEFVDKATDKYGFLFKENDFPAWCEEMGYCQEYLNHNFGFAESSKRDAGLNRVKTRKFFGYSGIVHPDEIDKSNDVRLSSIPKGETPICFMTYNKDAYMKHCKDYKEWVEWKKNRNPVRYENNKGHNYDSKNLCHTIRLMEMGVELAEGKGFNVRRNGDDVKHLLDIRNHVMSYEEIMKEATELKEKFDNLAKISNLPEEIDYDFVNKLLIFSRKIAYNKI